MEVRTMEERMFFVVVIGTASAIWLLMWAQWKFSQMDAELRLLFADSNDWGKVRLDIFAIRVGVHASIANWYLTRKARQFNALREIDEFGDVVFLFGEAKRKFLQSH